MHAQSNKNVVQFTGIVVDSDGVSQLPGVNIYVPNSGRGTSTNVYGYFSMPTLIGDEIVVSIVGYEKQYFTVPKGENDRVNVLFKMKEDTTFLENVDIGLFPSERLFKEAILAMNMPDESKMFSDRLDGAALSTMLGSVPFDASLNARYYFDQQFYNLQNSYGPVANPFLNPFNWSRFFKSLNKKK